MNVTLQDIDLRYKGASLYTTRSMEVGGNLSVDGSATVAGLLTPSGGYAQGYSPSPSNPQPPDHGLIAWSYDPVLLGPTTTSVATNGTLYLGAVYLRNPVTVSKVWWAQGTAGAGATANQNFASLWNAAGTLMGSVNIDGKVTGANSPQSASLSSPVTNAPAGLYWVGLQFQATTAPCLCRAQTPFTGFFATNLSAAAQRYATNGTGLTALPASITPASNSLTGSVAMWVAVS